LKQRTINKYDFIVVIRHFQGSENCACFQGPNILPMDSMDPTDEPHPRFTTQACIVSIGGDALSKKKCWKDREISPDGDRDCRIASRGLQGGFK
jgi:hypothetical protein